MALSEVTRHREPRERDCRHQLATHRDAATNVRERILTHPKYLVLDERAQKAARQGEWRLGKPWIDLAETANFDRDFFSAWYSYLSSYAHAGAQGVDQIASAGRREDQDLLADTFLQAAMILACRFLRSFCCVYPHSEEIIRRDEASHLVSLWADTWGPGFSTLRAEAN